MLTNQSIAIMNQFSNKSYSSKGSTPASFVKDYMARNDATLTVYPVNMNNYAHMDITNPESVFEKQSQILLDRRMTFDKNRPTANDWYNLTTLEGRSFSQDGLSLSKSMIDSQASEMQNAFNNGHTVLKIVASFDNQYLKDLGVEKGNHFHGDIDEMKLRLATRQGCQALSDSLGYSKPLFIGSIQLDRDHPHAHIAMCETAPKRISRARRWFDDSEYGRISTKNKDDMRVAIDSELENNKFMVFMPSNQVEHMQNAQRDFTKHYATLPQQKKIILAKAANTDKENERFEEILLSSLTKSVTNKTKKDKNKVRKSLRTKIDNKEPTPFDLPPLLNLQMNNMKRLQSSKKKSAKMMLKIKKAHEKEEKAKLKELEMLNNYLLLNKIAEDEPSAKYVLEKEVKPYYEKGLINASIDIDKQRLKQFQPVKDIPNSMSYDHHELKQDLGTMKTPFEKAETKQRGLRELVYWHQRGYINHVDITNVMQYGLKKDTLPTLDNLATSKIDESSPEFMTSNKYINLSETSLAQKAYEALDKLPETGNIRLLKSDLQTRVSIKPKKEMPQKITKEPIKHYKSVSYKKADDMIIDSLDF